MRSSTASSIACIPNELPGSPRTARRKTCILFGSALRGNRSNRGNAPISRRTFLVPQALTFAKSSRGRSPRNISSTPTLAEHSCSGRRNVLTTTADFSGIAFLTEPQHLSPLISRLRVPTSSQADAEWDLDYDFKKHRINASTAFVNYHFGAYTIGGGDAFCRRFQRSDQHQCRPAGRSTSFAFSLGMGIPPNAASAERPTWASTPTWAFCSMPAVQTAYNWDCCGFSVEYRRFALGSVRNENQFRFNFALANIGSFGNLRRQEKLF